MIGRRQDSVELCADVSRIRQQISDIKQALAQADAQPLAQALAFIFRRAYYPFKQMKIRRIRGRQGGFCLVHEQVTKALLSVQ